MTTQLAKNTAGQGWGRRLALKAMSWTGYGGGSDRSGFLSNNINGLTRFFLPGSHYDYQAEAGPLWKNSAIAACLAWVRKNFPEPRLKVERREGHEWIEDPDHKILDALENPNPFYDDDVLWSATCLSLIVDGNAYWYVARAPSGRVEYWWVPHWQMKPCWPESGEVFISHYEHTVDGKTTRVPKEDVIHFRTGIDPENDRLGWSELKACLREVCTDNEAGTYSASVLRNMGIVGVVISPESSTDEIDKEGRQEIKALFKRFTGEGRGEPLVNSVPLRINEIGATPEKMVLEKVRKIPESRIAAAIGIPAMVVGLSVGDEGRTFSNLGEANRHAYQNCIMPLQKSMAKTIQRASPKLIADRRRERLVWDYANVEALREDRGELIKQAAVAYQGQLIKKNEGRTMIGLPPDPGPDGDAYCAAPTLRGALPMLGKNTVDGDQK